MTSEPGLRERKKQRTRAAIAETAHRLFRERGFDAVTVAEVAREAEVSEGTVFNYFPTKEDLFYGQMESFEAALVEAVGGRPPGESALEAFRRFVVDRSRDLALRADVIVAAARVINASAALQAREREIVAEYTSVLGALLAQETGRPPDDVEPRAVAGALMSVQRALVQYVRTNALAGIAGPKLARNTRAQATRAFERLERGLADYGRRGRGSAEAPPPARR